MGQDDRTREIATLPESVAEAYGATALARQARVCAAVGAASGQQESGRADMLQIELPDTKPSASRTGGALWNLGFRPFYFLAGIFAAVSIALWVGQYAGYLPTPYLSGAAEHGQEMLFGYTLAVVAGFLFTAVRNWTNRPTPTGATLVAFAMLWIAGRLLAVTRYALLAAWVDAAFPVAVAIGIAVPLLRSGNRRNYFFVALLGLLGLSALIAHFSNFGGSASVSLQTGLDLVLFILVVMGGRVIPMFTNNGVPGVQARRHRLLEALAPGSVLALLAADALRAPSGVIVFLTLASAAAQLGRLCLWQPWRTLASPLVWILHASYAWIAVHLGLRALVAVGVLPAPLAIHALTIGAIGGMTIGMMTRTSKGHTGRLLIADRYDLVCYCLIQLAAIVRVFGGMSLPSFYRETVIGSGIVWIIAFGLFAARYWAVLSRPRLDGKPG